MKNKYLFYIFAGLFMVDILIFGIISFPVLVIGGVLLRILQQYQKNKEFPKGKTIFGIVFSLLFIFIALARIFQLK
ncbi:hypothetical protein A3C28_04885 [Candidatus Roizmanbacteria bacterium RIFCSPHIGHO2_02_FULL_39_9]|uniref:Uncharacterized protein n=2 Tax=Candidatus Roizmaniibacteriota TaxID=1752723 RepID=A0A1F7I407_9BACT|nr:MAG: hypothetical protein A3C28_04885 [Candidatus Roizmanbacteria bacterium RIFCSPHIGHO2_02_FULL_39_9]OGK38110.1 MAG: hypothetical protein A3F60_00510 [Candidatus Roizmanbacteria bacterium RIFCSPHIGHO2_12_FULL_39_8]